MTTNSAYSSSHPEALACWERTQEAWRAYQDRISEWLKQFPEGFKAMTLGRSASQHLSGLVYRPEGGGGWLNAGYVTEGEGDDLTYPRDENGDLIPLLDVDLWRFDKKEHYWVPRRDAKGGKAAKERRLAHADSLNAIRWSFERMPGLPEYIPGYPFMGYGCTEMDGEIWVTWSIAAELVETHGGHLINHEMWRERKLSEYHAAREAHEASKREVAHAG